MPTTINALLRLGFIASLLTLAAPAVATGCADLKNDLERLGCYDAAAAIVVDDPTILTERKEGERALWNNRYGILPHRRSYLLPLTYAPKPGRVAIEPDEGESVQRAEVKFQYSFKVPVARGLLLDDDQLYFGFTQLSLWQAYNGGLSSPFRENVYEPELIWSLPLKQPLFGGRLSHVNLGINHQSNGRGGEYSRSWNRITFEATWADAQWALGLRAWHRIKESADEDDNPDIEDFLGHGELRLGYKWDQYRFTGLFRNNLKRRNNHSSVDLNFSWPLNDKLSGFVQFYNGYGETLLDYDHRIRRVGFGVILVDWF